MSKEIYLPSEKKEDIYKTFKTNKVTLRSALKFITHGGSAKQLRAAALQRGGVIYTGIVPESFMADCETVFDHENNRIIQKFGADLSIEIDQTTNTATFSNKDKQMIKIPEMTMDKWNRLLYGVQLIISQLN